MKYLICLSFVSFGSFISGQNHGKFPQQDEYSLLLEVDYTPDTSVYTVLFDSIFYEGGLMFKKHFNKGEIQYSVHPYSTKSTNLFPEKGVEIDLKVGSFLKSDTITAYLLESKLSPGYAKIADITVPDFEFRKLCEFEIVTMKVGSEVIYFEKWQRKLMLNVCRNIWNRESARPYFQPSKQ